MCTVIFSPSRRGYLLGMNRDEQRTRVIAHAPRHQTLAGRKVIFPSEPGGGTWVGVNDAGISLALVNWYAVAAEISVQALSRGEVVRNTLSATSSITVDAGLRELPLDRLRPFRLIGVFPGEGVLGEWLWDHRQVYRIAHSWKAGLWTSSAHDERGANAIRTRIFRRALQESDAGSLLWLRRLLCSHLPTAGAYSICMHRSDAVTVSRTEIQVSSEEARVRYQSGPSCKGQVPIDSAALILPVAPARQLNIGELDVHETSVAPLSNG